MLGSRIFIGGLFCNLLMTRCRCIRSCLHDVRSVFPIGNISYCSLKRLITAGVRLVLDLKSHQHHAAIRLSSRATMRTVRVGINHLPLIYPPVEVVLKVCSFKNWPFYILKREPYSEQWHALLRFVPCPQHTYKLALLAFIMNSQGAYENARNNYNMFRLSLRKVGFNLNLYVFNLKKMY